MKRNTLVDLLRQWVHIYVLHKSSLQMKVVVAVATDFIATKLSTYCFQHTGLHKSYFQNVLSDGEKKNLQTLCRAIPED